MSLETDIDLRERIITLTGGVDNTTVVGKDLDKIASLVGLCRKGLSEDEVEAIRNEVANDIFG